MQGVRFDGFAVKILFCKHIVCTMIFNNNRVNGYLSRLTVKYPKTQAERNNLSSFHSAYIHIISNHPIFYLVFPLFFFIFVLTFVPFQIPCLLHFLLYFLQPSILLLYCTDTISCDILNCTATYRLSFICL